MGRLGVLSLFLTLGIAARNSSRVKRGCKAPEGADLLGPKYLHKAGVGKRWGARSQYRVGAPLQPVALLPRRG